MTDDKTRQATAPGDDDTQLEGQTVLEGFQAEDTEERVSVTMDRFVAAIHDYREFIVQRDKSIEENETILCSDEPLDKDTAQVAYYMKELSEVMREQLNPEAWMEATRQVASRLESMQRDLANGFNLIAEMMKDKDYPPPANIEQSLKKLMDSKGGILESLDTFISRFKGYSPDDITRIVSDIGTRVMERLSQLSPEELAELERELDAEPGEPTEKLDTVLEEAAIEVLQSGHIRQGTATNTLTKIKSTKRNTKIDPVTHAATIKQGDMVVTIPNWDKLTGLKTSTHQLLDACTTALTNTGWKRPQVAIRLSDYMQLRGLKDEKEARKQVNADLETLFNTRISFKEKRRSGKSAQNYADMRICDYKGIKNGVIYFSFGSTFFELMKSYTVMPLQPQLFKLNSKRNPNSYYLLRRLMEHKNMNVGKENEDIISVKTLLEACKDGIPSYEEVMAGNKHVTERIIVPFERDMDALEDTLTWEYCHTKGAPLSDAELGQMDYTTFSELLILTHWKDYPDQTARLERKQAKIEEAKAKKKRGRKPKKPPAE